MKLNRRVAQVGIGLAAASLALAGCRGESSSGEVPGITEEACPEAVNEDNGCIYLGVLSDLTKGPFAPLAVPLTDAQKAFWQRVNEQGGVGGYDIDINTYTRDTEYNPEIHNRHYQEIRTEVFALAQTLGSSQTMAIIDDMREDDMVAGPASWNSAWEFDDLIIESGSNYCFDAMNGIDWATGQGDINSVLAIGFPGDYGGDAAAGAEYAAQELGLDFKKVETPPGQDNQAGAVAEVLSTNPDVLLISTGPAEMATIVGGAAAQGYQGIVLGSGPTWNPALLQSPAAPALEAMYYQVGPWGPFGTDSPGHQAMRDALPGVTPNDGYTAGWVWSYPMLAALKQAADAGELTREGLKKAAANLEDIDFEGMLPDGAESTKGDPSEVAFRQSIISGVDTDAPTGVSIVQNFTAGPTAQGYDFSSPCFSLE